MLAVSVTSAGGASASAIGSLNPTSLQNLQPGQQPGRRSSGGEPVLRNSRQEPLYAWGRLAVRPHAQYRLLFADGVQVAAGRPVSTYIQSVAPGLLVEAGDNWSFDYTTQWMQYSHASFRDTRDHNARFDGSLSRSNWGVRVSQSYASTDSPMIETARQTAQETANTTFNALLRTRQFILRLQADQNFSFVEAMPDVYSWSALPSIDYQAAPGLQVGAGLGAGYLLVYRSSDMSYLRPVAQLGWQPTGKTGFDVQIGMEEWTYVATRVKRPRSLYYQASANYRPFEPTNLKLRAKRGAAGSHFQDQTMQNKGWEAAIQQRLLKHFSLSARFGSEDVEYVGQAESIAPARADRIRSFDASFGTTFRGRGSVAISYSRSKNTSTLEGYGFSSEQIGFQIGYKY